MYQTRETVFHHISKQSISDEIQGVWKCDETLS